MTNRDSKYGLPQTEQGNGGVHLQLVDDRHGFDDYDVTGHLEATRVKVAGGLSRGDIFNVYGPGSTKRGASWMGSLEESMKKFLGVDTIHINRELPEQAQTERPRA